VSGDQDEFDIKGLLAVALDDKPTEGFADRVLDTLAIVKTAVELSRLIGVAPVQGLVETTGIERIETDDEGEDDDADE
jgi:hypothetical protein